MKHLIVFHSITFLAVVTSSQAQDSTAALFKTPRVTHLQWDLGYSGQPVKGTFVNSFDATILGVVFNEKWSLAIGLCGWVKKGTDNYLLTEPPAIDSYVMTYLSNEYLVRPKKLINFSFPLRIAYGGASGWDTVFSSASTQAVYNWNFTGKNYFYHSGEFWTISPGANIFINIFKSLSLGFGANYRFTFITDSRIGSDSDYSGYSIRTFLRLKLDTREYTKRMLQRQQEILGKKAAPLY